MYKTVVVLVVLFLTENETYKSSVASESYKDMETCRAELDRRELNFIRETSKIPELVVNRYSPKVLRVQDIDKQIQHFECLESWIIE
jgi:hypothetical protein